MSENAFSIALKELAEEFRECRGDVRLNAKTLFVDRETWRFNQFEIRRRVNELQDRVCSIVADRWDELQLSRLFQINVCSEQIVDWMQNPDKIPHSLGLIGKQRRFRVWLIGYDEFEWEERQSIHGTGIEWRCVYSPGYIAKLSDSLIYRTPSKWNYGDDEDGSQHDRSTIDEIAHSCNAIASACDLMADLLERRGIVESAEPIEPITCNPDCTFVKWGTMEAKFSDKQAACFMVLLDAWRAGAPPLSTKQILNDAPMLFKNKTGRQVILGYAESLSAVFRSNNKPSHAWGTLITWPKPGLYGLSLPKPETVHV